MNIDGMAEKYLSNSSYHYADNNPVLNYDVDGNYFANSFSQRMASSYQEHSRGRIASNNSSITYMQSLLDEGGHFNDIISVLNDLINVLNNSNSQLQSSIDEVSVLMISNQAYNIIDAGESAMMGITSYDKISRIVNINAPLQNGFGLLGHEIRHAYQFDRGIEGLAYTGARNFKVSDLIGIDLADEWNAYKIQNSLEPGTGYSSYNELLNDSEGPYKSHPRIPSSVSQHAEIQKILNSNGSEPDKNRWFNNLSNRTRIAFRINGTTYEGNY